MVPRKHWKARDRFLIRHQDKAIVVVEKKAGLLTVRTESGKGENLLSLLRSHLGARKTNAMVLPVHRLDRVVSGLLVFARTHPAKEGLVEQFKAHTVERRYLACVSGLVKKDQGTFESRLITSDRSLVVYSEDDTEENGGGRRAVTHFRVVERFERANATLVEVELETGLRNQIRVHFAEAGHPLLGEKKYAPDAKKRSQDGERIFLHAYLLGFDHPITREHLRFEARLPPDLYGWKETLRKKR